MKPEYKKVKVVKPHCPKCKQMLLGNGSIANPYYCQCGTWEYNWITGEYRIKKDE